jgi:hypothetical protein
LLPFSHYEGGIDNQSAICSDCIAWHPAFAEELISRKPVGAAELPQTRTKKHK